MKVCRVRSYGFPRRRRRPQRGGEHRPRRRRCSGRWRVAGGGERSRCRCGRPCRSAGCSRGGSARRRWRLGLGEARLAALEAAVKLSAPDSAMVDLAGGELGAGGGRGVLGLGSVRRSKPVSASVEGTGVVLAAGSTCWRRRSSRSAGRRRRGNRRSAGSRRAPSPPGPRRRAARRPARRGRGGRAAVGDHRLDRAVELARRLLGRAARCAAAGRRARRGSPPDRPRRSSPPPPHSPGRSAPAPPAGAPAAPPAWSPDPPPDAGSWRANSISGLRRQPDRQPLLGRRQHRARQLQVALGRLLRPRAASSR